MTDEKIITLQIGNRRVRFLQRGCSMIAVDDEQPKPAPATVRPVIGLTRNGEIIRKSEKRWVDER